MDDVLDQDRPAATLQEELSRFLPWHPPPSAVPVSEVRAALGVVDDTLGHAPAHVRQAWRREGENTVGAMRQEALRRERGFVPSLSTYLRSGTHSVAAAWMGLTLLALCGNYVSPNELAWFRRGAYQIARACRLLNDLATWQRESAEQKTNAVHVLAMQVGSTQQALQEMQRMYAQARAHAVRLEQEHPPPLAPPVIGLVRMLRVLEQFYSTQDFPRAGGE